MASIGGVTVDIIRGRPTGLRKRTTIWNVPGIDGTGLMTLGRENEGTELQLIRFGLESVIHSWLTSLEALQGTIFTVVDNYGRSYTNLAMVTLSRQPVVHAAALAAGNAADQRGLITCVVVKRS